MSIPHDRESASPPPREEIAARLTALVSAPKLALVLRALDGDGEETRIVGGAVRDVLLGRSVNDVDLATTALPEETVRRARAAGLHTVPTGIDHGTVTVVARGTPFEVTTLREDIETDGRHAMVRFGRDFAADARRRDFTMNALSVDRSGHLHDPVGGLPDLWARRLRFIGDPRQRICEDYLRTLRFFRFHAQHGRGPLDRAGLMAAIAEREGLRSLSAERVRAELLKLLAAPRAVETVSDMAETGIFGILTGGVADLGRLARAAMPGELPSTDAVTRLGALAVATTEDVERLRERLRLSNAEHRSLLALARLIETLHDLAAPLDRAAVRRLVALNDIAPVVATLTVLQGEPRPRLDADGRSQLLAFARHEEPRPLFPLTGADILRQGVAPGPEVGARLAKARQRWLDLGCPSPEPNGKNLFKSLRTPDSP